MTAARYVAMLTAAAAVGGVLASAVWLLVGTLREMAEDERLAKLTPYDDDGWAA